MNVRERNEIIGCLFDTEAGLFDCDDTLTFEHRLQTAQQSFEKYPKLASYFQSRLTPLLQENFRTVQAKKPAMPNLSMRWTNNNCESLNHVIKQAVDWKTQKLPELAQALHDMVTAQYREVKRSLLGLGDYQLRNEFNDFRLTPETWAAMDSKKRERHLDRFINTLLRNDTSAVRSANGLRFANAPTHGGKKPSQRKRKRTAKTTTLTNKSKKT